MKNIYQYVSKAEDILRSCGVPFDERYIKIDTKIRRTTHVWGRCYREWDELDREYYHRISINPVLLDDSASDIALMNTLLHEYIHTAPEAFNHGKYFKMYSSWINRKYTEYNIQRCTSQEEKAVEFDAKPQSSIRYKVTCLGCGKSFYYKKKTWWIAKLLNGEEVVGMRHSTCGNTKNWKAEVVQVGQ